MKIVKRQEIDHRSAALRLFDAVAALARDAGLSRDRRVVKTLRLIASNPEDMKTIRKEARRTIDFIASHPRFVAAQSDLNPFRPYPAADTSGPIVLGRVYDPLADHPRPFGLRPRELNENVLVCGRAGSGKTVILMRVAANLLARELPFLAFDFKRDYRSFIAKSSELLVLNWKNFRFNPLAPPPGVETVNWLNIVADVFFRCFFTPVPLAAKAAFIEAAASLYTKFHSEHGPGVWPCLRDFDELAGPESGKRGGLLRGHAERLKTSQSRIRPLLAVMGEALDCSRGYQIEQLLDRPVVLELDGLSEEVQAFLVTLIFYWIFSYRLHSAQRGSLRHVLICDEAKMIFSKDKASGSSPVSRFVSTAREFGQGLLLAEQMPSTLGHAILANINATICLNLSAAKDIHEIGYAMGLTPEQRDAIARLPVGVGIVRLAGRIFRPFMAEFPDFPIEKCVTDAQVARHMARQWSGLNWNKRHSKTAASHVAGEPGQSHVKRDGSSSNPGTVEIVDTDESVTPAPSRTRPAELSAKERMVLTDIANRPFMLQTERTRSLRLTTHMAGKILGRLIELGLTEQRVIRTGRRGKPGKFYKLTRTGASFVGPQNLGPGKGGFEHVFHQQRFAGEARAAGFEARIEEFVSGKSVDVGLTRDGHRIALEIEMSAAGAVSNIEKDLAARWDEVWTLCGSEKIRDAISREWTEREADFPGSIVLFHLTTDAIFSSKANEALGS